MSFPSEQRPHLERTVKNIAGIVYKLRDLGAQRGDFVAGWLGQKRFISVIYLGIHDGVVFYVPHVGRVEKAFSLEDFDPQVVLNSFNVDEPDGGNGNSRIDAAHCVSDIGVADDPCNNPASEVIGAEGYSVRRSLRNPMCSVNR